MFAFNVSYSVDVEEPEMVTVYHSKSMHKAFTCRTSGN